MIAFGLIDDRKDARESFRIKIGLTMEEIDPDINIIDIPPFKEIEEYIQWILENEISLLIVDERLYEEKLKGGGHATYSGHYLVNFLRTTFKDLPIYCITNYNRTQDLDRSYKAFNLILRKDEFGDKEQEYLNLFARSARNFYKEHSAELQSLNSISTKIALGEASEKEILEAKGIQEKLAMPHSTEVMVDRMAWLAQFSDKLESLKKINGEIKDFLKKK